MPYLSAVLVGGRLEAGEGERTPCVWLALAVQPGWRKTTSKPTDAQGFLLACFPLHSQKGLSRAHSLLTSLISHLKQL